MIINKNNKEIVYQIDKYQAYKVGIVNLSNDSFHHKFEIEDRNQNDLDRIKEYSKYFDIIDIGAESSKPSAIKITKDQEI